MDLHFIPKQAYINALISTEAKAVNAEDFEIEVLLEWIKLFQIDIEQFDVYEDYYITFNVVDYYITINIHIVDIDSIVINDIDCTDDRLNHAVIAEYFKENNNHLEIYLN